MCGIAAIFGNDANAEKLTAMLEPICHRGEATYFNESKYYPQCSLGMNRLAIVDEANATQPISTEDGRYHIVFNGEIYNYKEIRADLQSKGYAFSTDSDTEVLLKGFREYGKEILPKLSGMFSFFVYDSVENNFFAARDPLGVKPLYWAKSESGSVYFGSEIKSLANLPEIKTIHNFPAGQWMDKNEMGAYFTLPTEIDREISLEDAAEKLRVLFDEAVKKRVDTPLPIAVYLSGGIDSTAVLATARKYHPDVTAIIAGNEESTDRQVAVRYCEDNNIPYKLCVPPTEEEMAKTLPEIVRITESFEPNMIRQSALSYHIAKTAADTGFKVVLCGEGADEVFAGYPEFAALTTPQEIEARSLQFLGDLHRTQLQRVDRTSMHHTTEVREPFLDKDLLEFVLTLPGEQRISMQHGAPITKRVLRMAMSDRLPEYVWARQKVVLSEGVGYKGNQIGGGLFEDIVSKKVSDEQLATTQQTYPEWNIRTKEEAFYFQHFTDCGYGKATFNQQRTTVNRTSSVKGADKSITPDDSIVSKILSSFNTWSFKRQQPRLPEVLHSAVTAAVEENKPIPFVMYWGKGERNFPNDNETDALVYMNTMLNRIKEVYPHGAAMTLILTDTHAQLNGHSEDESNLYFGEIERQAAAYGIKTMRMSELTPLKVEDLVTLSDTFAPKGGLADILKDSAAKHSRRYAPEEGAQLYYVQNQIEKKAVSAVFPDHIFVTYSNSKLDSLFPEDLPIFYMNSTKGHAEKPWFRQ